MSNMPLRLGRYLALCDRCHFKRYDDQLTETWNGLMVCKPTIKQGCWEPRHPQDFARAVPDDQKVPWARPRPADVFTDTSGVIASSVGVQEVTIPSGNFNWGL